jgi:hypothetical protein
VNDHGRDRRANGDLISMSQNMGAQRASLVEAAKKETNALAEALNLSAQAIGSTVRGHGEQLSGLVGQASSQGAALQTAIKQQAEQLKGFADKQTADFAAAIDALSKRIEAATQGASARSDQMQAVGLSAAHEIVLGGIGQLKVPRRFPKRP